jgi:hypothetical protein
MSVTHVAVKFLIANSFVLSVLTITASRVTNGMLALLGILWLLILLILWIIFLESNQNETR